MQKIQLCWGKTVLQHDRRQTVFGQCVSLSATTAIEDSSQILAIQVGAEELLSFSLFRQFRVEPRMHFSFPCSRESAKVEQIIQWKTVRCDEMMCTVFGKVSCSKQ